MPERVEFLPEGFVRLPCGALPRLDVLFDEGPGQGVCEVGCQLRVARIADNLDDAAVPQGHNPNVLSQLARKRGRRLEFRPVAQAEFACDFFHQGVLLHQLHLSLHV